jgi:hypothetical protein
MTDVQINGAEQILAGTIVDGNISTSAAIATDKLAQGTLFLLSTGTVIMGANLNLGSFLMNNLANGLVATDAVNLGQVESLIASATSGWSFEGPYAAATAYSPNQFVTFNNGVYLCIQAGTGEEPDISPTYWTSICEGVAGTIGTRGSLTYIGTGAPGMISGQLNGDVYIDQSDGTLYWLVSGTWTYQFTLSGGGGGSPTGSAGGDLGGAYPSPEVNHLQGNSLSVASPTVGHKLTFVTGGVWQATSGFEEVSTVAATSTIPTGQYINIYTGSAVAALTLSATAHVPGWRYLIKNATANTVTLMGETGNIDGASTYVLSVQYSWVEVVFDGTNFWVIGAG